MARKKIARKKTVARRKKSASKRSPARPKKRKRAAKPVRRKSAAPRKKPAAKRPTPPRAKRKRGAIARRGKPAAKRSAAKGAKTGGAGAKVRRKPIGPGRRVRDLDLDTLEPLDERGLGLESGGQAGDTEGLSRAELAAPESVEELVEEGQAFEAGIVDGVENAPNADRGPIRTREVPEDDVPEEYIDQDRERS